MKTQIKTFTIFLMSSFLIAGCSKDEVTDLRSSADIIYEKATNSMENGNYRNATNYLEVLTTSFPFSNQAKQAQLDLIFAHYRSAAFEDAIDEAKQSEKENPTHPRVDSAL
ncbi:MAG: outer membrane protein assembly factor BamD, partial [Gammaproteobacteria bacterium]|nr:outer membrane protein assembly factor BamD [Gammaproteobacteria bacterium]